MSVLGEKTAAKPGPRFCTLEYRPRKQSSDSECTGSIILLVVKEECGVLQLRARQDWQSSVDEEDRDYLDALMCDFMERAQFRPEALFQQLCFLGSGPLVTREAGSLSADRVDLLDLCATFKLL